MIALSKARPTDDRDRLIGQQAGRILTLEAALRRARDIIEGALLTSAMREPCPPADYPAETCLSEWPGPCANDTTTFTSPVHVCSLTKGHLQRHHFCTCGQRHA